MELFNLFGKISIDTEQANKDINETKNEVKDAETTLDGAFSKIGQSALAIGKGVAAAGGALATAWIGAIEGTREYRVSMGKLETAFTTSGHSAETAKKTYETLNSVLGDSDVAVEAANHLAKLVDNEKDMNTWTNICTGVFATFGDSLPIEGLTEAANETAKTGQLTGGLTDALNWAGVAEDDFQKKLDACTTEQERQKLITSTLNKLYGESAESYKKNNKELIEAEKANGRLKEALAQLGAIGEPILTAIKNAISDMATKAIPKVESLINKVKDMRKWIKENQTTVKTWTAVIIGATTSIAAFVLIMKFSAIMAAAKKAIQGVTVAMKALNVVMKANLIGLIVSLIIGLVAAFVYLWKNNEGFRNFWLNMWDKIKSATSSAVKWIANRFDDLKAGVKKVQTAFGNIKDAIAEKLEAAKDKVKSIIDKIKGYFPFNIGKIFSNLKIPKISVSGGKAPFGIAGKGKLPSFSVKWNAEGAVFKKPAIFSTPYGLQGVGEAGAEAIAPISTLQSYVAEAVRQQNTELIESLDFEISRLISFMQGYFPTAYKLQLDTGVLAGHLAPEMNARLADIYRSNKRSNTR